MSRLLRNILYASLALVLAACNNLSSLPESGGIAGNNSATLTGNVIGSGESTPAELRKALPVTLTTQHPDLALGQAFLTRISTSSEYGSLIVELTNNGSSAKCFVRAEEISYRSSDATIVTEAFAYISASVGRTASGTFTDTCLDSGETGYLIDIQAPVSTTNPFWTDVESVEIGSLSTSDPEVTDPGAELIPTGYSVAETSLQTLTVTGKNGGNVPLYPGAYSLYILLDDAGDPLEWGFLDSTSDTLSSGQTSEWEDSPIYDGSASRIHVKFDFEDEPQTSSMTLQTERPLSRLEALALRNASAASKEY
jgi:hypothetical protein